MPVVQLRGGLAVCWVHCNGLQLITCCKSQDGWTAVLCAAVVGGIEMLRELVEYHGADLYHKANVSIIMDCSVCDQKINMVVCLCESTRAVSVHQVDKHVLPSAKCICVHV